MTNTRASFDAVLATLNQDESAMEETVAELERLRKQISILENRKTQLKKVINTHTTERDSLQRKLKIEEEGTRVAAELAVAKDRYADLLKELKFPNNPYDHQFTGAAKLAVAKRGMCADKRGLGKTLTGILWRHFVGSKKTLYLAPSKLCLQSQRMLDKWDGENGMTLVNLASQGKAYRDVAFKIIQHATDVIVLLNYESWRRDKTVLELIKKCGFDAIICDEIHNAKESNKLVARGLQEIAPLIPNMLEMTGTPFLNRPQEVWSPLNLLYPDIFPDKKAFENDFLWVWGSDSSWKPEGKEKLAKIIAPFYVARDRDDVGIQIPPPDIITYPLTLENHSAQQKAYRVLTERAIMELKEEQHSLTSILAIITRQRQMISWPPSIMIPEKDVKGNVIARHRFDEVYQSVLIDFAVDLINELVEEGERILLFNNFVEALHEIKRRLTCSVALYIGSTPEWQRELIEKDFDLETASVKNPKWDVMLATYKTVGEGLNLNAARHAILLDREWNPGREEQAIGRIDRINSVDKATVHIPEVEGSIMEFIRDLIEHKAELVQGFSDATKLQSALIEKMESELK